MNDMKTTDVAPCTQTLTELLEELVPLEKRVREGDVDVLELWERYRRVMQLWATRSELKIALALLEPEETRLAMSAVLDSHIKPLIMMFEKEDVDPFDARNALLLGALLCTPSHQTGVLREMVEILGTMLSGRAAFVVPAGENPPST